jgi:two-component system LytT family response regulator
MRILIIEDEPLVARDIQALIQRLEPAAVIVGLLSSVRASCKWLADNPAPDLVLSDIQLSDGISFEIFEKQQFHFPIIFTTAYNAYAIRAFKLNSIDYLLKPIDEKELGKALEKHKSLVNGTVFSDQLRELLSHWGKTAKSYKERFLALHRNALTPVEVNEIAYFHKDELIYLHTLKQEKLISEQATLDEIENMVNPQLFFRVNRQYLIHIQAVARIRATHKGLSVELKPAFHLDLEVSREKAMSFKKWAEGLG